MKKKKSPILESISGQFGNSISVQQYQESGNLFAPEWHFHPEIEIVYVNGGEGKRHIGNHISHYSDGDLVMIGSNLPHFGLTNTFTRNKSEVVIQFKEDFLGTHFFSIPEMRGIKDLLHKSKRGIAFQSDAKNNIGSMIETMIALEPFQRVVHFLRILKELSETDNYELLNIDGIQLESKPQDAKRLDLVYALVRNNFARTIQLSEVADLVSMSEPSFSRYFRKKTGKTFTQFVNEYRLVHASKLLSEGTLSITAVCYECGFNNFSHFTKKFKSYTGKSPSQYRNELNTIL